MSANRAILPATRRAVPIASLDSVVGFERSTRYRLTCAALLLWWIAFLYPLVAVHEEQEHLAEAATATEEGSLANRILVLSFAGIGAMYLPRAIRGLRRRQDLRAMRYFLTGYLLWSGATILWSDDPAISIRRVGVLVLLLIGMIGLGAGFYAQTRQRVLTIARHVLFGSFIAVALLFASRLLNHSLSDLLNPQFSLKQDTNAQYYIYPVAFGIIAAVIYPLARRTQIATLSILSLVLLLLKGRAMIAGTLAVGLIVSARLAKRGLIRTLAFGSGVLLILAQIDMATGARMFLASASFLLDKFSSVMPYVTLGNGAEDLLSLDGRVPLWEALWPYFNEHPIIGHGFGAFWNPARFDTIYVEAEWRAVVAHNGFLDELLGTGVIGLVLLLGFWLVAMRFALKSARQDKRAGYLVFGWLLLFLCFNSMGSIMQFYFQSPMLFAMTAFFALLPRPATYILREGAAGTYWSRR